MNELTVKKDLNFEIVLTKMNLSTQTMKTYIESMNNYEKYCKINEFPADLDSLKAWIKDAKNPNTQAVYTAAAKKVFSEIMKGDPRLAEFKTELSDIKKVKRDLSIQKSKYLTRAEVDTLVEVASERVGLVIKMLFITGLRISELLNIKTKDCVKIEEGKAIEIPVLGKGSKMRTVYIDNKLFEKVIEVFNDESGFLFSHDCKKYNAQAMTTAIRKASLKIGKDISAHSLRHSRAYDLMDKEVSLDKVSKFLGHSSISTTADSYLHLKPTLKELGVI